MPNQLIGNKSVSSYLNLSQSTEAKNSRVAYIAKSTINDPIP